MKSLRLFLLVPVAAVALAGCSQKPTVSTTTESTPTSINDTQLEGLPTESTLMDTESSPAAMVKEDADFTVEMSDFKFSVSEMKVKAGQTVTVKLVNNEGTHDFMIDEIPGAKSTQLKEGGEETITFTVPATAKGKTFEYYCSVMQHRKMGMVGKLIVE